jgi:hypothetical protein
MRQGWRVRPRNLISFLQVINFIMCYRKDVFFYISLVVYYYLPSPIFYTCTMAVCCFWDKPLEFTDDCPTNGIALIWGVYAASVCTISLHEKNYKLKQKCAKRFGIGTYLTLSLYWENTITRVSWSPCLPACSQNLFFFSCLFIYLWLRYWSDPRWSR